VEARGLVAKFNRCELRGGFTTWQGQAKKGNMALTCSVDVQYTGTNSSLYVGEDAFRLGLPNGNEVGPTVAPNEALYGPKIVPNVYLGFMIEWPAPGTYILRVVNPGLGEKRAPSNVAEIPIQL
jgi:hypothetical protein